MRIGVGEFQSFPEERRRPVVERQVGLGELRPVGLGSVPVGLGQVSSSFVMTPCLAYAVVLNTTGTIKNVTKDSLSFYLPFWGWGDSSPTITDVSQAGDGSSWLITGLWMTWDAMKIGGGFQVALMQDGITPRLDVFDCTSGVNQTGSTTGVYLTGCTGCQSPPQQPITGTFCATGQHWDGTKCATCPAGSTWNGTSCTRVVLMPVHAMCPAGQSWDGHKCACPAGQTWSGGKCVKIVLMPIHPGCPPGQSWNGSKCVWPVSTVYTGPTGPTGATGGPPITTTGPNVTTQAPAAPATGMSTGAIVAIGVAAVAAIGGLGYLMYEQKRKHAASAPAALPASHTAPVTSERMAGPFEPLTRNPRKRRRKKTRIVTIHNRA